MQLDFSGRTAVVTGGASGIGRAVALALARRGARVFSGDLLVPQRPAAAADPNIVELSCDVRREQQVRGLIAKAAESGGGLHFLVSNAGINLEGSVPTVTAEQWDACLDTNLKGAFLACKYAIPRIREAGGGAVVFTSSNAGLLPRAHDPVYSTSKAALNALAAALALAHAGDRIRFNAVCPGPVADTTMMEQSLGNGPDRQSRQERFIAASPLANAAGRMISPEEVAAAVLYLLGDAAAMVTGTALRIDGGKSLGVPPGLTGVGNREA